MPSDPSSEPDRSDRRERPAERADGGRDALTEADVERISRRVVREELDASDRRRGSFWTVVAGVVAGLLAVGPASGFVAATLTGAGVPGPAVAALLLLAAAALVAYGWRLPPFR